MAVTHETSYARPSSTRRLATPRELAMLGMLLMAGCAGVPPHPPVPPVKAELVPKPPRSQTTVIWQPGHWDWTGKDYAWIEGVWVKRAGHGTLWQDGFWQETAGKSEWVPAHWL